MNNQPRQGPNYSASAHNVVGAPALQAWGAPNSAVAAASALGAITSPTPAANSSHAPLPRSTALLPIMEQHNRDLQEQLLESRAVIQQLCAQMMQEEERVSDLVEVNYLLSQQLQQLQQLQLQQLQGDQAEGSPQQQALPAHPQQQLQLQLPLLLGGQAGSHSTSSPGLLSPGPVTPSRVQLTESEAAAQAVTAACAGITIAAGIEPGPAGGAGPCSSQAAPAPPPRTPVAAAAGLYQLPSMNVGELGGLPHRSSSIQLSVDPGGPAAPHPSHLGAQCAAAAPPQGLAPLRTTPAPAGAAAAAAGVDLLPLPKLTLPARALRRKRSDTLDQEQCGDVSPQQVPAAPVAARPIAAAAAGRHINDLDDTAAGSDAGRGIADRAVGQAAAVATLAAGLSGMPPVQPVPDSASSAHSAAVSAVAASLSGSDGSRGRAATPQLLTTHVAGAAGGQLPHLSPLMLVTPLVSCQVSPAEQLSPTRTSGAARGAPGAAGGTGPRVCPLPKLRLPAAVKPRGSPCSYSSSGSTPGSHKSDSAFFRSDELFDAALADASLGGSGEQLLGLVSLDGRSNPPMFSTSGSFDQRYGCQGGRDLPGGGTYMGDMGDAAGDTLGVSSWMGAWSEGGCELHSSSGAHGCGTHMMYAQGQTALGGAAQELQDADTAAAALAQAAQQLDQVLVQQQLLLRQKQQQQEQQQQQQQGNAAAAAAVGLAAKMVVSPLPAPAPPPLADALPHLLPPLRTQRRLSNEDHGSGGSSTHQGRTPDLMVPSTAAATSTSSPGGASSPGHTAVYTPVSLAIEEELTAAESDTPPAAAAAGGGRSPGDALVQGGTSSGCSPTAAAAGVEAGEGRGGLLERGMPSRPPSASPFAAASQQQQPPAAGPATGGATGGRSCSGRLAVQRSGSIPSPMRRLPPLHIPPAGSQASCSSFAPAPAGPDAMLPAAPAGGATAAAAPAAGGGGNGGHAEGPWPYRQLRITTHHVLGSSVEAPSSTATPARVPSSGNLRQGIPPPSPGGATRYVPGSPCIVGFDCTTPVFLRSPSWRSEAGGDSAAAPSCCSGASTPKRQPASPGLLAQVLSRSSLAGGGSGGNSGASTPLTARARRGSGVFGAQYHTPQRTSSNASMGCTTPGGNGSSGMGGHGQPVLHLHGAPGPMDSSVLARSSMLASGMLPPAFHGQQQQPGHMRQRSLPELPTVSHLCDAHHPGYHHPQQQQQPHLMMPSAGASGAGSGVASSSRGVPTPRSRSGRSAAAAVDGSSSGRGLEGQGGNRRQHGTDSSSVSGGSSPGDQPPDISAAAAAAAGGGGSGACLGPSNTAVAAVAALRGSPGVAHSNGSSTSAAAAAAAGQQRDLALNLQDMVSPRASPRHSSPRGRPGSTTPTGAAGNAAVHGSGGAHAGPRTMSRLSRAIDSQGRRSNRCGALAFEEDAEGCAHQQQQQQAEEEEQQHHQQRRRHARSRHVTWRVSEAGEEGQDGSDTSSGGSSSSNSQAEGCQAAATAAEGQAVCDVLVEAGAAAPGLGAPAAAEPAGATDEEAPLAAPSATAAAATAAAAGGTAPVAPAQAPNTTSSSSSSSSSTITSSPHDAEPAPADPSPPDALRECGLVTAVEVCPAQQQQASLGDVLSVLGDQGLDTPVVTRVLETPQQVLCSSGKQRSSYVPGYIGDAASAIRQCKQKAAVGAHHYAPQLPAAASSGGGGRPRAARSDPADDQQQQQRPCTGITAAAAASASVGSEEFRSRLHMFAAAAEAAAAANSGGASVASSRCSSAAPTPRVSEQGAEEAPSPGKHQHQQQQSMQQAQQQLAVMPGAQPGVTSRVLPTAMVGSGSCGAGASPKGTPGICPVSSQSGALGGSSSSSRDVLDCARQPDQSAAAKPCTAPSGSKSSGRSQGTAGRGSGVNAGAGSAASAPAEVFPAPGIEAHGTSSSSSVQQQPQQEEEQQHRVLDETSVGTPHAAAAPAQGGVQPVPDAAPPAAHASHLHPYQQQQQVVTSAALFARNLPHLLVLPAPEEGPASPPASPASASSRASSSSSGLGDAEDDRSSRSSAGGCSSPCGSSSSLDDDLLLSLHVPAQGGVGEVLLQMGVSVDSGAMRVARAQQQALMMRRHQQRQQALEALRSRQHLEQHQRQQQLAGEGDQGAQAVPGDLAAPGGSARPSHRPREGSGRLGTSHAALSQRLLNPVRRLSGWRLPDVTRAASASSSSSRALGSSGCADAGAVLECEGSVVEDGCSAAWRAGGSQADAGGLDGLPRELPTPSDDPADPAFTPGHFYAARHAPTTAAAGGGGGGGLQGTTSGGLGGRPAEDEDDGASMYSMGQQSGVSWSTSSQVNRTPRLEWWGKEGRYFSGRTPGFGPVREAGRAGAGNDAGSSSREASQQVAAADGSSGAASAGRARGQVWAAPTRVGALVAGVTTSVTRAMGPRLHQVTRYVLGARGGRSDSSAGEGTSSGKEGSDSVAVEAGGPSGTAAAAHQ